jgi:hypothetical protein
MLDSSVNVFLSLVNDPCFILSIMLEFCICNISMYTVYYLQSSVFYYGIVTGWFIFWWPPPPLLNKGPCFACGTTMKHPSDGIAYSGARRNGSYCLPFGSGPVRVTWCPDEDVCISVLSLCKLAVNVLLFQCSLLSTCLLQSDEEVERLRSLFGVMVYSCAVLGPSIYLDTHGLLL